MTATFIALFGAHLLADFALQPDRMIARKRSRPVLLLHVTIVTVATAVLLGSAHWPVLAVVFASHLAMDALKVYRLPPTLGAFLLDQGVHLGVILALAALFPTAWQNGLWPLWLSAAGELVYLQTLVYVSGLLLAVPAGGVVIGLFMDRFTDELGDNGPARGLRDGGRYIGWLERLLVALLYLGGQGTAIGFVIASKSILRLGEITSAQERKLAEYILIGTFLSFGWAVLCAALTNQALSMMR